MSIETAENDLAQALEKWMDDSRLKRSVILEELGWNRTTYFTRRRKPDTLKAIEVTRMSRLFKVPVERILQIQERAIGQAGNPE